MPDTPADTIRRAAALMRQRAKAATQGPWETVADDHGNGPEHSTWSEPESKYVIEGHRYASPIPSGPDAEHIAALHPLVALAVAHSWDTTATEMDRCKAYEAPLLDDLGEDAPTVVSGPGFRHHDFTATLAAARVYLREAKTDV